MSSESFFYVDKNYVASLTVITYTLNKYTDEKVYTSFKDNSTFNHIQEHAMNLMKKEKVDTIVKSLTINPILFFQNSAIIPQELQPDVTGYANIFHPLQFAHFLNFLCYYHLHDITSCNRSLNRLKNTQGKLSICCCIGHNPEAVYAFIFCGIADQLMGQTCNAKYAFRKAAKIDKHNTTSAESRLSSLIR